MATSPYNDTTTDRLKTPEIRLQPIPAVESLMGDNRGTPEERPAHPQKIAAF